MTRVVGQPFSPTKPDVKYALPPAGDMPPQDDTRNIKPDETWTVPLDPKLSPDVIKSPWGESHPKPPAGGDAAMAAWIHDFQSKYGAMVYEDAQGVFHGQMDASRE